MQFLAFSYLGSGVFYVGPGLFQDSHHSLSVRNQFWGGPGVLFNGLLGIFGISTQFCMGFEGESGESYRSLSYVGSRFDKNSH